MFSVFSIPFVGLEAHTECTDLDVISPVCSVGGSHTHSPVPLEEHSILLS